VDQLRQLLEAGADPDFRPDDEAASTFLRLVGRVPLEGLRLLVEAGANLAAVRPNTREGALHLLLWAHPAPADLEPQLAFLLDAGLDVDLRAASGSTPLYHAAFAGLLGPLRLLLERGAQPDIPGDRGDTPLHACAAQGLPEHVALLLHHGANPTLPGWQQRTALQRAVEGGHAEAADVLLRGGAQVDCAAPPEGFTALRVAVNAQHVELARLLVSHGANVHLAAADGRSPLEVARLSGRQELVQALGEGDSAETLSDIARAEQQAVAALEAEVLARIGSGSARFFCQTWGYKFEDYDDHAVWCDGGTWFYAYRDGVRGVTETSQLTAGEALARMRDWVKQENDLPADVARRMREALKPVR